MDVTPGFYYKDIEINEKVNMIQRPLTLNLHG